MSKPVHRRYKCEAAITVRHLDAEKRFVAKMLNYSHDGLYFEADTFFAKGSVLHTRLTDGLVIHCESEPDERPHKVGIAEVRWCRPINKDGNRCYGVGLRYI